MRWLWLVLLVPTLCFAGPESIVFESLGALVDFDSTVMSGTANEFNDGYAQVNSIRSSVFAATEGANGSAFGYGSMDGGTHVTTRFYFYLSADFAPNTFPSEIFKILDGAQGHLNLTLLPTLDLKASTNDSGGTLISNSQTVVEAVTKEAWHLVEIYAQMYDSGADNNVRIWYDGELAWDDSLDLVTVDFDNFRAGCAYPLPGCAGTIYFDDIVIDTTAPAKFDRSVVPPVRSTTHDLFSGGFE